MSGRESTVVDEGRIAPTNEPDDRPERIAYLSGRYDMCALLLTSPRMNRAQREVIEMVAYETKEKLEALGVTFTEVDDA